MTDKLKSERFCIFFLSSYNRKIGLVQQGSQFFAFAGAEIDTEIGPLLPAAKQIVRFLVSNDREYCRQVYNMGTKN